ncbi:MULTISPECIES: DEAD/DEAH box helicase [unclassified Sphingomonas]|uniref:DEAD/DEAH box helicase n=1 Tax=unclassified Sphingomonas TaxID=196159 RepID=UPI0006FF664C|nr:MULTISPECIES: DEAD/DEAH box helicase [unclassified Sphingomonas]KQM27919.1 DEAD/DEAH box helicase [Sphingomonas sp. Leaf9]KQM44258.1 DEAD/DEAH box helicase [Sphingomonas sp. Leaf11]
MSLADLQAWLLKEGVGDEIAALTRMTVRSEFSGLAVDDGPGPEDFDWQRLILAGSILARSERRGDQEAALRIAVSAVSMVEDAQVRDGGAVLLGKLSNFRSVDLAVDRGLIAGRLDERLGLSLRIEAQRREMDRSVLVETTGRWIEVNEFQQRFWTGASTSAWLSASAPTASGKTFLVLQWLVDQMGTGGSTIAVYLAPTRALVSEIESNLETMLKGRPGIVVSSLPLRTKFDAARSGGSRLILVLTQERMHLLANVLGGDFSVDLMIVDEAHKIGDDGRGVILQDAVERATRLNPRLKLIFISPATQNPGELLADAPPDVQTVAVDSDAPTVLQNLILARQEKGKPRRYALAVRRGDAEVEVGVLQLPSTPATFSKRLAFVAAAATGARGGTLVYANGAAEAEDIADFISQLQPEADLGDVHPELAALADLARKGVHPQFRLAPLVEQGVAFHFGNMPSLLRLEIERLFRSGRIRFLVCTSTLVEGVNLSCRTIVVRGPRKGKGNPMEPHDFWNLAGRAGRWGDEFQGNIVCLDPENVTAWPSGVPLRARYPIRRESDAVLDTGHGLINYLTARLEGSPGELDGVEEFEQVGAYLLTTFMRLGSIAKADFAKRHDPAFIAKLDGVLETIATAIEIEPALASRHSGVSPIGMQRLLETFRRYPGEPENLAPVDVASDDCMDRFITIMRRINASLFPAFTPDKRVALYAIIVLQWLEGKSLARIIRRNIAWHEDVGKDYQLPALIRDTMALVEQIARFRAPKYLSAYVDVLHLHYLEIGREDLIDHNMDIGTQLEFGVSSRTLISLMELGLSRMTAVALYEKIARDDLDQTQALKWMADRSDRLDGMDLPVVIVRELRERLTLDDGVEPSNQTTT